MNFIKIRKNNGLGFFGSGRTFGLSGECRKIVLGDIDADGDLDLVSGIGGVSTSYGVSVLKNDGNGDFSQWQNLSGCAPENSKLALGDIDTDGDLDIVWLNQTYFCSSIRVEKNNGEGTYNLFQVISFAMAGSTDIKLGDLDNDGDLDAAFTGFNVVILTNNATGLFSIHSTIPINDQADCLTLGDIDHDNDLDIGIGANGSIHIFENKDSLSFSLTQNYSSPWTESIEFIDIDSDDDLDLTSTAYSNLVSFRFNQGLPTITDFTPTTGAVGTILTLRGRDLRGVTAVSFTGTGDNIVSSNLVVDSGGTRITGIVVPPGTRTGPLTVTTQAGTSAPSTQIFTLECAGLYTPAVSIQGATAFCAGDSVRLSTSDTLGPNQRFLWSTGDTARQITVRSSGTYSLRIRSTRSTCVSDSSTPVIVRVAAIPALTYATPLRFCTGDSVILQGPDRPDETCLWSTGDTTRQIIVHGSGTYSLRMRARSLNCTSSWADSVATLAIARPARPTIMAASPLTFCQGDSALLTTTDTLRPGQFFHWNTGDTGRTLLTRVSGTYSLQIRSSLAACVSDTSPQIATQQISLSRPVAVAQSATSFCSGDSVVLLAPAIPTSQTYRWSTGDTTRRLIVRQSGVYTLRVLSRLADCASLPSPAIITDSIALPGPPVITALGPTRFYLGDSVILQGSPITPTQGYLWSTGDTARRLVARASGRYTLRIVSSLTPCTSDTATGVSVSATPIPDWPTITSLSPTANSGAVPRNSDVVVNFSRPMSAASASAASVQVFSSQRGGKMYGTNRGTASVSGNSIRFDPAQDFMPGERVFVTTTTAARSTDSLALQQSYVHEFTTATGGTGRGYFPDSSSVHILENPLRTGLSDLDGDGDLDMVIAYKRSSPLDSYHLSIQFNDGSGRFTESQNIALSASLGINKLELADFDSDGDIDIVIPGFFGSDLKMFTNNGSGFFSASQPFILSNSDGGHPKAGDIDGDGDLDLAMASDGRLSIQINDGTGNFTSTYDIRTQNLADNATLNDIDNDGDLDLTTSSRYSDSLTLHYNNGLGVFTTQKSLKIPNWRGTWEITWTDIDGDFDLDLAVSRYEPDSIYCFVNHGNRSFSRRAIGMGVTPRFGDFDGDQDIDMVSHPSIDNGVTFHRNNGSGMFTEVYTLNIGNFMVEWASGDIDGDQDLDLAITDYYSRSVKLLFNDGPTATTPLLPTPTLLAVPNPATAAFHLQGLEKPVVADLLDATGRLVRSFKTTPGQELNLEGLAQGLYRWRCQGQSGNLIVR